MPRKPGSKQKKPLSDWIKVSTKVSPETKKYLEFKKSKGVKLNWLVDQAIKFYRKKGPI